MFGVVYCPIILLSLSQKRNILVLRRSTFFLQTKWAMLHIVAILEFGLLFGYPLFLPSSIEALTSYRRPEIRADRLSLILLLAAASLVFRLVVGIYFYLRTSGGRSGVIRGKCDIPSFFWNSRSRAPVGVRMSEYFRFLCSPENAPTDTARCARPKIQ